MPDQREPRIRGSGHPLPFSKGRMATNLFLSGVEAEHAYELALDIERAVHDFVFASGLSFTPRNGAAARSHTVEF